MKRFIVGIAALVVLAIPQAALSKKIDEGSAGNEPASAQQPPQAATPNFSANGNGTATSCGAGCTVVSGTYTGNQLSGTFVGQITQDPAPSGCSVVHGVVTLYSGTDSVATGFSGAVCGNGAASHFAGTYAVTDGTGAYQENGAGWGDFGFTLTPKTFTMSAHGTFYPEEARTTGVSYGP